jgi:MFS family permease
MGLGESAALHPASPADLERQRSRGGRAATIGAVKWILQSFRETLTRRVEGSAADDEVFSLERHGDCDSETPLAPPADGWRAWLALNASTGALLGAILLVGMGSELWLPLMPEYLNLLEAHILVIALFGCAKDALDAAAFYLGGTLSARFNTRRTLLLFNALPLVGLFILLIWPSKTAVFVALPFVGIWNSIAGPATLRVVGDTLSAHRRSMAFSLQSIQKRLSSLLAYFISGQLVLGLGGLQGVRAGVALSLALVAGSLLLQYRFMRTAVVDAIPTLQHPLLILRRFDPQLRRLLVSDILARWCEGLAREFLILYCISILAASEGMTTAAATAFYVAVLLSVMNVTSLVLYLPIGHLASKPGAAKKPFIGLTFVFFSLFPLSLVLLGPGAGEWGLVAGFVIGGLREVGEPARKAMVTELAPAELRTQAIGVYWAVRSLAIMLAPLIGGLVWLWVGPDAVLWSAGAVGGLGTVWFYLKFAGASPVKAPKRGDEVPV